MPSTEGDTVLRKWLAVGVGLAVALMLGQTPARTGGESVTGVITNWYQVKNKVSEKAYFQLVKKEEKLSANTDRDGLAAIKSDLPRLTVRNSGGFQVDFDKMPPGEYFIVLQRGLPSVPILVKDGRPVMIKVPGKFPLSVGNVKLEMPLGYAPPRHHMEVVK
jgi:hypothetical protein